MTTRNGYMRIPTRDHDTSESPSYGTASAPAVGGLSSRRKKVPKNLRPGLFYMFGDRGKYVSTALDHSESDAEGEHIELLDLKPKKVRTRRGRLKSSPKTPKSGGGSLASKSFKPKLVIIEEPILPNDSIQRVSLRYGCPVSEIRRVNNLYKDQDFFALKTVKIPVKEHGVLTDTQMREKCRQNKVDETTSATSGNQSSGGATADELRLGGPATYYKSDEEGQYSSGDADDEVGDSDGPEYRDVSIQSALKWKHSSRALLNKFDEDLHKIRENAEQKRNSNMNEVVLRIDSPTIYPIVSTDNEMVFPGNKYHFLNCRLRVVLIIGLLLVVGFFVVLFLITTGIINLEFLTSDKNPKT